MNLTKEECEKALNRICFNYGLNALDGETNEIMDMKFGEDVTLLKYLINEHFELVEEHEKLKRMLERLV